MSGCAYAAAAGHGRTALHLVVQQWLSEDHTYHPVVELLLRQGADPNATDIDGETPLHKVGIYQFVLPSGG